MTKPSLPCREIASPAARNDIPTPVQILIQPVIQVEIPMQVLGLVE